LLLTDVDAVAVELARRRGPADFHHAPLWSDVDGRGRQRADEQIHNCTAGVADQIHGLSCHLEFSSFACNETPLVHSGGRGDKRGGGEEGAEVIADERAGIDDVRISGRGLQYYFDGGAGDRALRCEDERFDLRCGRIDEEMEVRGFEAAGVVTDAERHFALVGGKRHSQCEGTIIRRCPSRYREATARGNVCQRWTLANERDRLAPDGGILSRARDLDRAAAA
jgi:hypothetical protein